MRSLILATVIAASSISSVFAEGGSDLASRMLRLAEQEIGVKETPGPRSTERIIQYWQVAEGRAHPDSVPWCSAFVKAVAHSVGADTTGATPVARSWLQVGRPTVTPRPGDVVVLWRGSPNSSSGHVGFYVRESATHIYVLGGNQGPSSAVTVTGFQKTRVLGYQKLLIR